MRMLAWPVPLVSLLSFLAASSLMPWSGSDVPCPLLRNLPATSAGSSRIQGSQEHYPAAKLVSSFSPISSLLCPFKLCPPFLPSSHLCLYLFIKHMYFEHFFELAMAWVQGLIGLSVGPARDKELSERSQMLQSGWGTTPT